MVTALGAPAEEETNSPAEPPSTVQEHDTKAFQQLRYLQWQLYHLEWNFKTFDASPTGEWEHDTKAYDLPYTNPYIMADSFVGLVVPCRELSRLPD